MSGGVLTVALMRLGLGLARWVPFRVCAAAGAAGGWLAGWASPRRRVVAANLEVVTRFEASANVRAGPSAVFAAYGRYWGEFLALAARASRLERLAVRVEGEEHLRAAAASGPVCILTGHLGNWDLGAQLVARRLPNFAVVAEELRPPARFRLFVRARQRAGCAVIPAERGGVRLYRHLHRGGHAGMLADRVFGSGARAVSFLGGRREFPSAGLQLARRAGAVLLPAFLVREGRGYRLRILPPLPPAEDPVESFARVLEVEVCAFAEQWCVLYPLHSAAPDAPPARLPSEEGRAARA